MVITFLNWIYIAATSFAAAHFIIPRIAGILDKDSKHEFSWSDYFFGGIIITTLYAEVFSLFSGVGIAANVVMLIIDALFIYIDRKSYAFEYAELKSREWGKSHTHLLLLIPFVIITLLCLKYTAESTFHYDTGLYHAQAIHWIEDYGVIPGLGHIHVRLAYNSALFSTSALYSFHNILGGQSLHSVPGLTMCALCLYSITGWYQSIKHRTFLGRTAVADLLRLAPFLYLLVILIEMTSPESDYITIIYVLWACIRFAEIIEKDPEDTTPLSLLAVATFAIISFKLSAAVFCMITILPLVQLIRRKQWKNIIICGVLAVLMVLPYIIRNIIICGWPVYPVAMFGFLDFPWKFNASTLTNDANEIGAWGKATSGSDGSIVINTFREWLVYWWYSQNYATQLMILSVVYAVPIMCLEWLERIISRIKHAHINKKIGTGDIPQAGIYNESAEADSDETKRRMLYILMMIMMILCMAFYMKTAPLIRYCYAPVMIFPLLVSGYGLYLASFTGRKYRIASYVVCVVAAVYVILPMAKSAPALIQFDYEESVARYTPSKYIVNQIDYPIANVREVDYYGYKCYLPADEDSDQCWYYAFPSSPYHEAFDNTRLIGDDLKSGVMDKN